MVVPTPVCACAHADNPFRVRHLVVALAHRRRHLVRHGPCHNHDVGLARGGAEDDAQSVLVVARHGGVHHFDAAAGEAEGERPEGALASPVDDGIEVCTVFGENGVGFVVLLYGLQNVFCSVGHQALRRRCRHIGGFRLTSFMFIRNMPSSNFCMYQDLAGRQ